MSTITHTPPGPGRHASFLAGCSIGGIRVALAPPDAGSEAEFKTAAAALRDKLHEVRAFNDEARKRMGDFNQRLADVEQKAVRPRGGHGGPIRIDDPFGDFGQDLGAQVANSDALREFKAAGMRGTQRVEVKTTITSGIGSVGGALGGLIPPDRAGVQPLARRPLSVRSLCRNSRTESNLVTLMVQTTRTNNAAAAPEGTLKGESGMTWAEKAFKVSTIAHWVPVTRQALEDAVGLQALINSELRYMLAEKEEDSLLYGNGVADNLLGIFPQAQAFKAPFVVAGETAFDRLLQALAQASVAQYKPSAIVLNTADAFMLHSIKDSVGRYIGGGPYEGLVNLLWSIPWVASNAVAPNDFLLGDFANAAEIFDRMDAEVLITDSHGEFFVRNLYCVRAEQRLALVVRAPQAFVAGKLVPAAA